LDFIPFPPEGNDTALLNAECSIGADAVIREVVGMISVADDKIPSCTKEQSQSEYQLKKGEV